MTKHLARPLLVLVSAIAVLAPTAAVGATAERAGTANRATVAATATAQSDRTFAVGVRSFTFVDPSRPTAPNGGFPGKPSRTLPTTILYPARGPAGPANIPNAPAAVGWGPFPLVVFSHGFTANGPVYTALLRRFAEAGYVVAAPTFPLSSGGAPGGPRLGDYVNQPADVSFVIDSMLRLSRWHNTGLTNLINKYRIGVSGHSLGAVTSLGFLNSCCVDRRIDAVVPVAGIEVGFPGGTFTHDQQLPLLLIHGDADNTVPFAGSRNAFNSAQNPRFLLTLLNGTHTPFFGPHGEVIVKTMTNFFDRYLKREPGSLRRLFTDAPVPGLTKLEAALG